MLAGVWLGVCACSAMKETCCLCGKEDFKLSMSKMTLTEEHIGGVSNEEMYVCDDCAKEIKEAQKQFGIK